MEDAVFLLLRLVHIAGGVFWVGAAVTAFGFVEPAAHDLGKDGEKFMHQLTVRRRLPAFVTTSAVLSLITGGWLYWHVSGGLHSDWIASPPGFGFTLGAVAAIVAAAIAVIVILPTLKRIDAVAFTPGSVSLLPPLEKRLRRASLWNVIMLALAVAAMATARYWR
jgi:uncharacterized membrane protein